MDASVPSRVSSLTRLDAALYVSETKRTRRTPGRESIDPDNFAEKYRSHKYTRGPRRTVFRGSA